MMKPGYLESLYYKNGTLMLNKLKALSRGYFYAICGKPHSTYFDHKRHVLNLQVTVEDCKGKNS